MRGIKNPIPRTKTRLECYHTFCCYIKNTIIKAVRYKSISIYKPAFFATQTFTTNTKQEYSKLNTRKVILKNSVI